jgi:hypothetical protein
MHADISIGERLEQSHAFSLPSITLALITAMTPPVTKCFVERTFRTPRKVDMVALL